MAVILDETAAAREAVEAIDRPFARTARPPPLLTNLHWRMSGWRRAADAGKGERIVAKVSVVAPEKARAGAAVSHGRSLAYLDGPADPIHLHLHELDAGGVLTIAGTGAGAMLYVWSGAVAAGGHHLGAGSSAAVEAGATLAVTGVAGTNRLLVFTGTHGTAGRNPRIHLLPDDRVPRLDDLGGGRGTGGGIHADATLATCPLWLHENRFPPDPGAGDRDAGIHAHAEDEVIFVTAGTMRLGARLCGPGTALAVVADTFYSFSAGGDGLSFVNFRAARPGAIRFRDGREIDEIQYWRSRLPRPEPISLPG